MGDALCFDDAMSLSIEMVSKHEGKILELLKATKIVRVEGDENNVLQLLDKTCGIDYYEVTKDKRTLGVASRWQRGAAWNTFTIRKSRESGARTEYEKLRNVIDSETGGERPHLHMQGYVDNSGALISLAAARTVDIIKCIERGLCYEQHTRRDQYGQASFYVVKWDVLGKYYKILVYNRKEGAGE